MNYVCLLNSKTEQYTHMSCRTGILSWSVLYWLVHILVTKTADRIYQFLIFASTLAIDSFCQYLGMSKCIFVPQMKA